MVVKARNTMTIETTVDPSRALSKVFRARRIGLRQTIYLLRMTGGKMSLQKAGWEIEYAPDIMKEMEAEHARKDCISSSGTAVPLERVY